MSYIDRDNVVSLYGSVLFKSLSLRGWIVVSFVPKLNVEYLVSAIQPFVLDMSLFFCTHRPSLFPINTFVLQLTTSFVVDAFILTCREEGKVVTWFPYGEPAEGSSITCSLRTNLIF